MSLSDDDQRASRRELVAFLRSRRARLSPSDAGLASGARRRTPGLRREEVAQLAGVGVTWYTWFEQGRSIQVSAHFLERVAFALRLDAVERAHLFALALHQPPPLESELAVTMSPALRRLLSTLPNPSYVTTARWDVLDWSPSFSRVFGDLGAVAPERRNLLWLAFSEIRYRQMMPDWERDARIMLANFRAEFGRHADDPAFLQLVRELEQISPEFRRWWCDQDVQAPSEGPRRFRHETLGALDFEPTSFVVNAAPDLRLVVYTPVPGESASRVARLAGQATTSKA
jgi:transcriptional regulator with XRE-family HTH domain